VARGAQSVLSPQRAFIPARVTGVYAQTLTPDLAEGLQMNTNHPVILGDVYPNGPAAQAGLQPGDVVTHLVESIGILGVTVRPRCTAYFLRFAWTRVWRWRPAAPPSLWGNRLQPGDVIFRIADRRVRTLQALHQALLLHDDTRILVTQVQRGFPLQYLTFGQLN